MIRRSAALEAVETALAESPVCALLGPRQCGKTTLAQQVAAKCKARYFDLEEASKLWLRGGMPRSFLAPNEPAS
ncbi:AAA family ATPase [Fontisphaera persica]|uniref:AAA family ATPase n=1 Tax=Fontisphaera persica TaxID=2974023 RepID=UPI0031B7FF23